jgi:hypothetical protein
MMAEFHWKMSPLAGDGEAGARVQNPWTGIEARSGCRRFWKVLIMFRGDERGEEVRGCKDGLSWK